MSTSEESVRLSSKFRVLPLFRDHRPCLLVVGLTFPDAPSLGRRRFLRVWRYGRCGRWYGRCTRLFASPAFLQNGGPKLLHATIPLGHAVSRALPGLATSVVMCLLVLFLCYVVAATPQPNGWMDTWVDFWIERRLKHMIRLSERNGGVFQNVDKVVEKVRACVRTSRAVRFVCACRSGREWGDEGGCCWCSPLPIDRPHAHLDTKHRSFLLRRRYQSLRRGRIAQSIVIECAWLRAPSIYLYGVL